MFENKPFEEKGIQKFIKVKRIHTFKFLYFIYKFTYFCFNKFKIMLDIMIIFYTNKTVQNRFRQKFFLF